jgi:hypothetical protein
MVVVLVVAMNAAAPAAAAVQVTGGERRIKAFMRHLF